MIELATIGTIIGLTKAGIDATGKATDLVKKFKAKSVDNTTSTAELKELAVTLAEQLMQSRMDQLEVQNQLLELQSILQKEDAFEATLALYQISTLPAGGVIYQLREQDKTGHHPQSVCPTCLVKDRIFIALQKGPRDFACRSCDGIFRAQERTMGVASASRSSLF